MIIYIISILLSIVHPLHPTPQLLSQKLLPEALGKGYHILRANPLTPNIDPGLASPIYVFTYNLNRTTSDSLYSLPDYITFQEVTNCEVQPKMTVYTGTEKYREELSTISRDDGRLSINFTKAAFTLSEITTDLNTSISVKRFIAYQSSAKCIVYKAELPLTNQISFTEEFIADVRESYYTDGWDQFVQKYGTHYVNAVGYGALYAQDYIYTNYNISLFGAMTLDIKLGSRIQFYKNTGMTLTPQLKSYQNQSAFLTTHSQVWHSSQIGKKPPYSGNTSDWIAISRYTPAPVTFNLSSYSVLFNFMHNIPVEAVKRSYQNYLNNYCQRVYCRAYRAEKDYPKPLAISFTKSGQISGQYKHDLKYDTNDGKITPGMRVVKIGMALGSYIDSLELTLSDTITQHTPPIAGTRPINIIYKTPQNDEIECVRVGYNQSGLYWRFVSMQFRTKKGITSDVYQGKAKVDEYFQICAFGVEAHFVGFYGRLGDSSFDSMGGIIIMEKYV